MRKQAKIRAPTYAVQWNYLANEGRKADRYGPYMLQAGILRSFVDPRGLAHRDIVQLGVVSLERINEVSHRHAFWVITEAALESLELETETRERISAELSKVVPLPSEGEIISHKNKLSALSRPLRKR
ncbi:MAG: hypothetical protein ABSC87_06630 [Halobacteriota archaeon]|jgi:hypothetical protein